MESVTLPRMKVWEALAIVAEMSRRRRTAVIAACALAGSLGLLGPLAFSAGPAAAAAAHDATVHYACSTPNSPHVPCRFSTPSGNIRCLWTPKPNSIVCELLATGHAHDDDLQSGRRLRRIQARPQRLAQRLSGPRRAAHSSSVPASRARYVATAGRQRLGRVVDEIVDAHTAGRHLDDGASAFVERQPASPLDGGADVATVGAPTAAMLGYPQMASFCS